MPRPVPLAFAPAGEIEPAESATSVPHFHT